MHHENAPVRPSLKTLHRQLEVELFLKANSICAVIFVCVLLLCFSSSVNGLLAFCLSLCLSFCLFKLSVTWEVFWGDSSNFKLGGVDFETVTVEFGFWASDAFDTHSTWFVVFAEFLTVVFTGDGKLPFKLGENSWELLELNFDSRCSETCVN